jgi:putative Ca2+/H+ antiporter (TMEM165/GDT1 family)
MDLRLLATVFATVFLAELGDKTQLATLLYSADREHSKLTVFLGAALGLVLAAAIGVTLGAFLGRHVSPRVLGRVAGVAFVGVGVWTFARA